MRKKRNPPLTQELRDQPVPPLGDSVPGPSDLAGHPENRPEEPWDPQSRENLPGEL